MYKVKNSRITLINMSVKSTVLQNIKPLTCFYSLTLKTRPTLRVYRNRLLEKSLLLNFTDVNKIYLNTNSS